MFGAGIIKRKELIFTVRNIAYHSALGKVCGSFDTVRQTAADTVVHNKPVHNNFYIMLLVLVKLYLLGKIVDYPVNTHSCVALLYKVLKLLAVFALSASYYRR